MAGVPSKIITPHNKNSTSANVPYSYNKSSIGLTGSTTSGTETYKKTPTKRPPVLHSRPGSKSYGVTEPTGSGPNIAGQHSKIKADGTKTYFDVAEPYVELKNRTNVGGTQSNVKPVVGQNAGESRTAPKKKLAATLAAAAKPADKPKTKPKSGSKIVISYQ